LLASEPPSILEVYPNPAKDYLIIGYTLDMAEVNGTLEIKNLKGEPIKSILLTAPIDKHTVVTQEWEAGIYIATVVVMGKVVDSAKFTVIN
jgi:hypothetical protein